MIMMMNSRQTRCVHVFTACARVYVCVSACSRAFIVHASERVS